MNKTESPEENARNGVALVALCLYAVFLLMLVG
jgi:hypothetical protein